MSIECRIFLPVSLSEASEPPEQHRDPAVFPHLQFLLCECVTPVMKIHCEGKVWIARCSDNGQRIRRKSTYPLAILVSGEVCSVSAYLTLTVGCGGHLTYPTPI